MAASVPEDEVVDQVPGRGFDPAVPSPARMWNYWVGGKDNFAADRVSADTIAEVMPSLPALAKSVRVFLRQAVHSLAADHGIRQFLDIGTGLPTADGVATLNDWLAANGAPADTGLAWAGIARKE